MADPYEMRSLISKHRKYSRKLGSLETMYHVFNSRQMDVCPLLFKVMTKSPVSGQHIRKALCFLVDEYVSLRLSLVQTGLFEYRFIERERIPISIHEVNVESSSSILNKGCHHKFNLHNEPLWNFTWVRSKENKSGSSEFPHMFQFVFIFHHALCDFHQGRNIVQSFIRNITLAQGLLIPTTLKHRPLGLPIEQIIPLSLVPRNINAHQSPDCDRSALEIYESAFASEIASLQMTEMSTTFTRVRLGENATRALIFRCKLYKVKVTSVIMAALSIAFYRLVKDKNPLHSKRLVIPIEVMVDLTRYVLDEKIKNNMNSVGAIHTPLFVNLDLSELEINQKFWGTAKRIQNNFDKILVTGAPMKVLLEEVDDIICNPPIVGKSPFVLALSNMGIIDDIVPEACRDEVRAEDFVPWTNVSIDDMPIFMNGVHTLNKCLVVSIGYCSGYTSNQTGDLFAQHVSHILQSWSKL